jgi:hypothetical protein
MRIRAVLAGLAALVLLLALPAPAEAGVPKVAITCGLVVRHDVHLYLTDDLYCPGEFGVRVEYPEAEGGPIPMVTVDLKGHTLRGSGRAGTWGITAFAYPSTASLRVVNGRVKNWDIGVGGDSDTRISRVKLVGNKVGFFCNGFCSIHRSHLKSSSAVGLNVGAEAGAVVTRTVFSRNREGAMVGGINSLEIRRSTFWKNGVGVHSASARVAVSHSRFIKNRTGVLVRNEDPLEGCADLHKIRFIKNKRDVVGPLC